MKAMRKEVNGIVRVRCLNPIDAAMYYFNGNLTPYHALVGSDDLIQLGEMYSMIWMHIGEGLK